MSLCDENRDRTEYESSPKRNSVIKSLSKMSVRYPDLIVKVPPNWTVSVIQFGGTFTMWPWFRTDILDRDSATEFLFGEDSYSARSRFSSHSDSDLVAILFLSTFQSWFLVSKLSIFGDSEKYANFKITISFKTVIFSTLVPGNGSIFEVPILLSAWIGVQSNHPQNLIFIRAEFRQQNRDRKCYSPRMW